MCVSPGKGTGSGAWGSPGALVTSLVPEATARGPLQFHFMKYSRVKYKPGPFPMWCAGNCCWGKGPWAIVLGISGILMMALGSSIARIPRFSLQALMLVSGRRRLLTALLQAQKWPFQPSRDMRLVQFQAPDLVGPHLGLETGNGGGVINLNAFDPTLPKTMTQFLEQGEATLSVARRALAAQLPVLPRSEVTFLAPVTRPDKVVCVGMNYVDHCKEQNVPVPKEPIIFSKFASSIVGPYDEVVLPPESQEVDWEAELAVVIGKKGKHIKATDAMAHVAGFTVAHDVSARDWQMRRRKQKYAGENLRHLLPSGPCLGDQGQCSRSTQLKDLLPSERGSGPEQQHQPDGIQDGGPDSLGPPVRHLLPRGCHPDWDPPRCRCIQETSCLSQGL
uniref:Fumarylacetoacetate hydrolase domain containing 2A n=1 Tax=Papio anubis TaxID=9555 RepID=A0A8I5NXF1_PAPAN